MNFQDYISHFKNIIDKSEQTQAAPYDNAEYLEYTKLNWSRLNRWMKTGSLTAEIKETVKNISTPQNWIVLTEPWCGDAAHNIPFIELISRENPLITVAYELRDSAPFRIEHYLTNGTKSIPKLIIQNQEGRDLAVWGPRPAVCQQFYSNLIAQKTPQDQAKIELQNWYNTNKGEALQQELQEVLKNTLHYALT